MSDIAAYLVQSEERVNCKLLLYSVENTPLLVVVQLVLTPQVSFTPITTRLDLLLELLLWSAF